MNRNEVPTARGSYPGDREPYVLAYHNVPDLIGSLSQEQIVDVNQHYAHRAFHQLMASREGDVVAIPATPENFKKMQPLLSWAKSNLGVQYVMTSMEPDELPFSEGENLVVVPYFSSPNFGDKPMWGLESEVAANLKNKISFANTILEMNDDFTKISAKNGVHPTAVLPYLTFDDPADARQTIAQSMETSSKMYADFAVIDASVARYPLGVVVQQSGGDGGYGTVIMHEGEEGTWVIQAEKKDTEYSSREEAEEALVGLVEKTGGEYKVTRYVDVVTSPSIGVYVNGEDTMPLPVTVQFFEKGSCVGGASQNSVSSSEFKGVKEKEPYMQALAARIAENVLQGKIDSAHIGIDFMIAGEKEKRLIKLMGEHPELAVYSKDCMEVGIAECNPRMTSLSLSVWPLLLYDNKLSNRNRDDITYEDIRAFYGGENAQGDTGGFAVWDYIAAPHGVTTESGLIAWIDRANDALFASGIFIVPRLPLEYDVKNDCLSTSVVLGMRPNKSPDSHAEFRRIISEFSSTCSLQSLMEEQ